MEKKERPTARRFQPRDEDIFPEPEDVTAHMARRHAGGEHGEEPGDVEGHRFRGDFETEDDADVEGHRYRLGIETEDRVEDERDPREGGRG